MNNTTSMDLLSSSFTPSEHRYYYGAYLNSAQNNIFNIEAALRKHLSAPEDFYTNKNKSELDKKQYVDFIATYFPIIHQLGESYSERLKMFHLLSLKINQLRNYFSHYYHADLKFDNSILLSLDKALLHAVLKVKSGRMKGESTRQILNTSQKETFSLYVDTCKRELRKHCETLRKEISNEKDPKRKMDLNENIKSIESSLVKESDMQNYALNQAFSHLIRKDKGGRDVLTERYNSSCLNRGRDYSSDQSQYQLESKIGISVNGLIFLISSFLSKKEGEDFRSKLKFFKAKNITDKHGNPRGLEFMATHWVFSYYAFKGIKQRLNTSFMSETLLTQMVDELSKVPNEVYENLSSGNKKLFVEDLNEFLDYSNGDEQVLITPVIRKRYEDKFTYFALRYLDEYAGFTRLRFQIKLGEYVSDRREKPVPGLKTTTTREVKRGVNVFCKLSEAINIKNNYFEENKTLVDSDKGWRPFPNPSYNLIGNNIPIEIISGEVLNMEDDIALRNSSYESKPKEWLKIFGADSKLLIHKKPMVLLSIYEIPALLHELIIRKRTAEEVEDMLLERFDTKVSNLHKGEFSEENGMPRVVNKSNRDIDEQILKKQKCDIAIQREITLRRIGEFEERGQATFKGRVKLQGKVDSRFENYEKGHIATWLADDIKRFMPQRETWKSYLHNLLQLSLAFSRNEEALSLVKPYFGAFTKYNKFINKALSYNTFDQIYHEYLIGRLYYFNDLELKMLSGKPSSAVMNRFYQYFKPRFYRKNKSKKEIASSLLRHPMVFPRGIFDEKPTVIPNKSPRNEGDKALFADWYVYALEQENYQSFYELPLDYKDHYTNYLIEKGLDENDTELFTSFKIVQGKKIRRVQMNDIFMKLMVDDVYKRVFGSDLNLSLSDIYLSRDEKKTERERALAQSQRQKENYEEVLIRESNFWDKVVKLAIKPVDESAAFEIKLFNVDEQLIKEDYVLIDSKVKLKDIGRYRYLLSDKKVGFILNANDLYPGRAYWDKSSLDNELTQYTEIRSEQIFYLLQKLEKDILLLRGFDGTNYPSDFLMRKNPNFKFTLVNGLLKDKKLASAEEIDLLLKSHSKDFANINFYSGLDSEWSKLIYMIVLIRNKFCHNQYPVKEFMKLIIETVNNEYNGSEVLALKSFSHYILEYVKIVLEKLNNEVIKLDKKSLND